MLSNSGHIQSILNPPSNPKANYVDNPRLSSDPRAWYYDGKQVDGSWWTQWLSWIQERSGTQRETQMTLGNANYPPWRRHPALMCEYADHHRPRLPDSRGERSERPKKTG
ncbi:hypothetical protein QNM99_08875 [Pseudomonas sp. PCH446]